MKRIILAIIILFCTSPFVFADQRDWQGVETALGRKGTAQGDMLKVTFPRSDLKVTVGEVPVEPGLALTSWIGFKGSEKNAMMMGDLVLLEKEVSPVVTKLIAEGVEITALHNHILNETPTVMYLHFSGNGDPKKFAEAMRSALSVTGTPMDAQQPATQTTTVDWTKVEAIFAKTGQKKGNLFQVGFPRKETIKEHGMDVPPYMGMATGINLQAVGNKAATTGDFVLLGDEVNPVMKALTSHNIAVTAIHSHMLHESPRLFFLHFWGYDEPAKLAIGLKAALDKTNSKK
jgi:Domain of Unknown Function (DUF1259)